MPSTSLNDSRHDRSLTLSLTSPLLLQQPNPNPKLTDIRFCWHVVALTNQAPRQNQGLPGFIPVFSISEKNDLTLSLTSPLVLSQLVSVQKCALMSYFNLPNPS